MSTNTQKGNINIKGATISQNTFMGAAKQPPKQFFAKCGFFEAALLYTSGHIPKNACAIWASPFKGMQTQT